jgi:hypothetical protein
VAPAAAPAAPPPPRPPSACGALHGAAALVALGAASAEEVAARLRGMTFIELRGAYAAVYGRKTNTAAKAADWLVARLKAAVVAPAGA